jgi:hypothetical protein
MLNRRTLLLAPLAWTSGSALAQESRNGLTRDQISAGWILLWDGETTFGWTPRGDAKWQAQEGTLLPVPGSGKGILATNTEFADYRLAVDFWIDDKANSGVFQRGPAEGEFSLANAYEVNLFDKHEKWPTGSINEVARAIRAQATAGRWNTLEIEAIRDSLWVRVNGRTTCFASDTKQTRGTLGLQYNGEGTVRFRNVRLQPLGLGPIFNGVNLDGWKALPGHPSVFTVTPEGWLNVKNGNGDLQSDGQYKDFVLQLDIISNGEHLNSGVFYRAIPGEFWSGYESQIRNQWQGDDRTKPVDYGTGGIYNRQPARKVVSTDHQWFTKTLIAHGPHMTAWVDGYQVSDFTDKRPPNRSGRNGLKLEAGVLSIQGHDPTTDLSFRNIRIVEMPGR